MGKHRDLLKADQKIELNKKIVDVLEEKGWRVIDYTDDGRVEIEAWSPAGEDLVFTVDVKDIAKDLRREYEDFDIDEHVEMWLSAKGRVRGVPGAVVLVHDAEAIDKMLEELALAVQKVTEATT